MRGLRLAMAALAVCGCGARRAPVVPVAVAEPESSWPGPHPCHSGGECAGGRCFQELPGVCGGSPGFPCVSDAQCGDAEVCSHQGARCGTGCVARCHDGGCGDGARCQPDGHCLPIPCTEAPRCAPHEECRADAVSPAANGCVPRRCEADRDCAPGVCIDGACAPHLGVCYGGPCRDDGECGGTKCQPPTDEPAIVERDDPHGCHADEGATPCAAGERCVPRFTDEREGRVLTWGCARACDPASALCDGGLCEEGVCRPPSCRDGFVCPGHLRCDSAQAAKEVGSPAGLYLRHDCARKPCASDGDCGSGACVDGACYRLPGSCWNARPPGTR